MGVAMKKCQISNFGKIGFCLFIGIFVIAGLCSAGQVSRRTLELKVGGAKLMEMPHPVKRASIAAPGVADIVVLSPHELYAYGKKVGYTSVILWEEGNGGRTLLDVVVSLDLTALKEKLHQLFPDEQIEVHASETGVVLSGMVSGPEVVEQVLRLTRTYLPRLAEGAGEADTGTGRSGTGITNLLTVGGIQQVMLEVKFAEVTRASGKDWQAALGIDGLNGSFTGAAGVGALGVTNSGTLAQDAGSLLLNFVDNAANLFVNIDNFTAALNFLEEEGLARVLAEPRLVTQSGQEASFLAGGEFAIPVAQGIDQITIEYKDFGVALRFTPVVLSDGKISLRVAPTVSQIASTTSIPAAIVGEFFTVPNLSTRRLETSVQLYDGQTLALAGLLQDDLREQVRKIPGLGDIPILGALFRSSSYRQEKTDLLIAVTPHLVKPNQEGALRFPGERMHTASQYEFYVEGRLEGERADPDFSALSQHEFGPMPQQKKDPQGKKGGLEGDFGHLPPM